METYDKKKKDKFHIFVNQLKKLLKKSIEEGFSDNLHTLI